MNTKNHIMTAVILCTLVLSACSFPMLETPVPAETPTTTVVPSSTLPPERNVSLDKPVRVSASWVVDPPERAVDGDVYNWWGAGGPVPQWIEVDLQGLYRITRIRVINEGPTGYASYQVYGRGTDNINRLLHVFDGNKSNNQTLEFSPTTPWEDIATIRIEINSGSGWVGLREIMVYSREAPKPLPVSAKVQTPLFLAGVEREALEPISVNNAVMLEQLSVLGRGKINKLAWSPDGRTVAAAGTLGVWLYDPAELNAPPRLLEGHTRDVFSVAFSPDGTTLLSASQDGTVRQWDAITGSLKQTIPLWNDFSYEVGEQDRNKEVWSMAFSPDETVLAAGYFDGTLRLWNLATRQARAFTKEHDRTVTALAFSPDGTMLVSSGADRVLYVWDVASGSLRATLSNEGLVTSAIFSPDGKTLAYGGGAATIQLWNTVTNEARAELSEPNGVLSLAFSSDGKMLASSSLDGALRFWDTEAGSASVFHDRAGWITCMAFSPDGTALISYTYDGVLQLWETGTGNLGALVTAHTNAVNSVAFNPDGTLLASGSDDGRVLLWDVETNSQRGTLHGHLNGITGVAFSPDGKMLASSSYDSTVRLWDVESAKQMAVLSGHKSFVRCVAFSPDGKLVASGGTDTTVRLWDATTGQEHAILSGHTGEVQGVAFSSDGVWLISASVDRTLRVWEVATGKESEVIQGNLSSALDVAISPDDTGFTSGGGDHSLNAWNWKVVSGKSVSMKRFPSIGHPGWVLSVTFSPDSRIIASANVSTTSYWVAPGEVHLYSADTGYPLALLRGHTKRVTAIAFSPDGKLLASGSADGSVRLWGTQSKGFEYESPPATATPASTPMPAVGDLLVGEWTGIDPGDGSNMILTIAQTGDNYNLTFIDEKASACGKDASGKPGYGIEINLTGSLLGEVLSTVSTSATCLSTPATPMDVVISIDFTYQAATDTIWDNSNQATWIRSSSSAWRDDFDGSLANGWRWIRENAAKWNLTENPGFLRIYDSPYEANGKIQNLLLRDLPGANFMIETHVIFEPKKNFQFAGLSIYQDDGNTLSFGRAFCDTPNACVGNGIYFDYVTGGTWGGNNFATSVSTPNDAYLRLERRDNMVTASFSYDGTNWFEIGSHTLRSGFLVTGIGLIASGDFDKSDVDTPADFDYFEVTEIP